MRVGFKASGTGTFVIAATTVEAAIDVTFEVRTDGSGSIAQALEHFVEKCGTYDGEILGTGFRIFVGALTCAHVVDGLNAGGVACHGL